jgi:hypothetical protein
MFRFADTKVNNGSCAAAANRAEATFSCAAANTNNGMNSKVMDAVYAASYFDLPAHFRPARIGPVHSGPDSFSRGTWHEIASVSIEAVRYSKAVTPSRRDRFFV